MTAAYDVSHLRSQVARIIAPTMGIRRGSMSQSGGADSKPVDAFPSEEDIDEFLLQCPLQSQELTDVLLGDDPTNSVELSDDELSQFLNDVED